MVKSSGSGPLIIDPIISDPMYLSVHTSLYSFGKAKVRAGTKISFFKTSDRLSKQQADAKAVPHSPSSPSFKFYSSFSILVTP